MRIAFVTETWTPSVDGVVTRLSATVEHLARMGHTTLVIAPDGGPVTRATPATVAIPALGLPFLADGKPWGLPLTGRVAAAIEGFMPDVVHVLNPFILGVAGVRVARRAQLPLVASFHQDIAAVAEHYHVGFFGGIIWAHVRRLHAAASLNLATSQAVATELAAHGIANVRLWPYGVDSDRFRPRPRPATAPRDAVTALYVGRLAPEKDLDRLAPLAGAPGVRLVVAGDGTLRGRLQQVLGAPNVTFTGWLAGDRLVEAYTAADVFVFPSTTETLGMVLLEAMASGLPVVAAASAPTAEVAGDSGAAILLDAAGWRELPRVIREAGRRDLAWERRSRAARARTRAWDWMAATEQLLEHYERLLAGEAPASLVAEQG